MGANDNLIQRMEFQLQINKVSQFDILSKEIPALVTENLEKFIDKSIQELGLASQFMIIDQLVLDLGNLDTSNLKYDIQEKFKLQFRKELTKQINKNRFKNVRDEDLTFFIFIYFIKNGSRPWWLTNQVRHFGEFAAQAYFLQPQKFVSYFKFFIKHPTYRKRILDNLGEDLLIRVLIQEKRINSLSSSSMIFAIKDFLKKKYRHWSETRISQAFKEIILRIFLYGYPIEQGWKLNLAIVSTLDRHHPDGERWQNLLPSQFSRVVPKSAGIAAGGKARFTASLGSMLPSSDQHEVHLEWFQFYLENGYAHPAIGAKAYSFREVNFLFNYLILNQLEQLTDLLLSIGSVQSIKKRFLGSISQVLLDQFFSMIAPSKRKLMAWVVDVYQQVQDDYKPINQTFINVKKSLNEITFELFLKKKLNQINDENYLRLLFKQSSQKFGVKYKDLLFFTLKSLAFGPKKFRGFNFYEKLSSIYTKDILKSRPFLSVERSVPSWTHPEQDLSPADFRSKNYVSQLFLSLYRQKSPSGVRQAEAWLQSNLHSQSLQDTADLLRIWEIFAAKFDLLPEQIVIPVLVEKHKNPSIRLSKDVFDFFKKKYRIQGLFISKKPEESRLFETLQEHKKAIPRNAMKSILLGLNLSNRAEKIDFQQVISLIHPVDSQWVPQYLSWVQKLLRDNQLQAKKVWVYNWFYHQLILLPQRNITLEFLQKKTLELIQNDRLSPEEGAKEESLESRQKMENTTSGRAAFPRPKMGTLVRYSQNSLQDLSRLVEILGRSAILEIFPESRKYGNKILLQLLTSKYEAEFLQLLKKHQFNEELQDFLLIQAPSWLKKQLLEFIFRNGSNPWNASVSSLHQYFEKNKWIQLSGTSLLSFIEKNLWQEIFENTVLSFPQLADQQLQKALAAGLISPSFWTDFAIFHSSGSIPTREVQSMASQDLGLLVGSDFLAYAAIISRSQVNQASTTRILESILFDYSFPQGHPFEEYQVEEFRFYILDLIQQDRKVLLVLLEKTESPLMLLRFLKLLDEKSLRFIIQQNHQKLGFSSLIKKMDAVFSFYRIKEKSKIIEFWVAWIEELYFHKSAKVQLSQVYGGFFRLFLEEGLLPMSSLIGIDDWKPLLAVLQLDGREAQLFVEEMEVLIGKEINPQAAESISSNATSAKSAEKVEIYLRDTRQIDPKVLFGLVKKVKSPALLGRILDQLDQSMLRLLIQEYNIMLGLTSLLKQLDSLFSFYKIKEEPKIKSFFIAWIELLHFRNPAKGNLPALYMALFRVLFDKKILSSSTFHAVNGMKSLQTLFQLEEKEWVFIEEDLVQLIGEQHASPNQVSLPIIGELTSLEEVEIYLRETRQIDPKVLILLVKQVKSPSFLHRMLDQMDISVLRLLIQEFHRKLQLPSFLNQLEHLFSLYKIPEEKVKPFFVAWISLLHFRSPAKNNLPTLYTAVLKVLMAEDILPITAFREVNGLKNLQTIFQLEEKEWTPIENELNPQIGDETIPASQVTPPVLVDLIRVEDFEEIIRGVKEKDRPALTGRLLSRVKSPTLLLRILKGLNKSTLRFLIAQHYRKIGIPLVLRQLDDVLKFFKIGEESKIQDFYTSWIGMLYFRKVDLQMTSSHYLSVVEVLIAEGILPKAASFADTDWKPLLATLALSEKESQLFLLGIENLSKAPKSLKRRFNLSDKTNFLKGRNPADLLRSPIGLPFDQYVSLVEEGMEAGLFNNSHLIYLREWLGFAVRYESKDYVYLVFQLYFLKNLKSISNLKTMKSQLFYSILEKLTEDRKDVSAFLSRLAETPALIKNIYWVSLEGVKKEVRDAWTKVWSQVNGTSSLDQESDESSAFIFSLFLAEGRSFFETRSDLRGKLADVSLRLGKIPMMELFYLNTHPGVFSDLVSAKPLAEIHQYFVEASDAQLKKVPGVRFLIAWFEEYFKRATDAQLVKFLQLFQRSFYSNSYTSSLRLKVFVKGFFRLDGSSTAYRIVVGKELVEMETFFRNSPEFFASKKPQPVSIQSMGSVLQILQGYLDSGFLPAGVLGLRELTKELFELSGADLDRLRVIIHAALQSDRSKQNFYKLLAYLDETWFLELIHKDLLDDLDELNRSIKGKARADFFADLRIGKKLDRMILIAALWARVGLKIKSPTEILLLLVDQWVERVDPQLVMEVFAGKSLKSALLTQLKVSSKGLKKIIEQETTEEEKQSNKPIPEEIEPIDYGEGVSIANAGLILLWPFYGRFFNALGMVGKEGMKGESIRERAIQLLQYIATGQTVFEEWDLTLNKILCGASPDFPVSPNFEPTQEEQELCEKLIKGCVYNWEKIRNTKMETFRETFIQREGRLYQKENRWELTVANKAYDVLLDTLPWNITMVNLSWMNTRITVQWR